jgi:predicted MFS family arabinose efflux permease
MMLLALLLLAAGMLAAGAFPVYAVLLAGLFLAGLAKTIYDAAVQAYLAQRVPFHRRGLVIGCLELSWAGSTLITIPLIGLLIASFGWRSPFLLLGLLALASILVAGRALPPDPGGRPPGHSLIGALQLLIRERTAWGALAFGFCISIANENVFVVYGAWLEGGFGLNIVALGFSTMVIGTAEMAGELLTAGFADRFGLKRTVVTGLTVSGVGYALLPATAGSLPLALSGLFVVFLSLELTIVSFLSLCTELLPKARATMMAGFFAAAGLGRVLGALMGVPVWSKWGVFGNCALAVVFTALALGALLAGLRGWRPSELPVPK